MIKANFNTYSNYVTDSLHQWDINQMLTVYGLNLNSAPEVHFSNRSMDKSIVKQSTMTNHVISVDIPNSLLQQPLTIFAHIGIYEGSTFKVVEVVEIPVIAKTRPSDYQIQDSDEEIYSFKKLENDIANRVTNTEFESNNANITARIDNIIAHNNDTEGNTELVDIRLGADGNTYSSAGESVRNQFKNISAEIKGIAYQLPNNRLADITEYQYRASLIRANNFNGFVYGIRLLALADGELEYGYLYSNGTSEKLGSLQVVVGESDYFFDEVYENTDDRKLYVLAPLVELGLTSTGGVGMWQLADGNFTVYEAGTWELAYGIITSVGIKGVYENVINLDKEVKTLKSNKLDLKLGEIILPSVIHVATGRQCNLWWSSIANVEEDKTIYFETKCDIGLNAERGFIINATEDMIGDHSLIIQSRDFKTRNIIDTKTLTIRVVSASSGSGNKNILMIGDSRTWQSVNGIQGETYLQGGNKTTTTEFKKLCDENLGSTMNFLGTCISEEDSSIRNLAESGWSYSTAYETINNAGGIVSYIENSCGAGAGATLDYVTIMYGVNDLMDWRINRLGQYDYSVAKIDNVINNAKMLIDLILNGYPNCKIILTIEPTTVLSQDGFAYWAGDAKADSHIELELAMKVYRKRLISEFDNLAYADNVIISSAGLWCDRKYGYPYITEKISARASSKTIERFVNSVHPHDDGYKQIADGYFSTLKYLESL